MKKQIILGLILAIILGAGLVLSLRNAGFVYAQSTFPLLADQTTAYFEIPSDLYRKYKNTLEEIFSQILGEKPNLGLVSGEKVGFAKVGDENIWFIKAGDEYVLSSNPNIPELSYSLSSIYNKIKLKKTNNNGYFNQSLLNIFEENDKLLILLGNLINERFSKKFKTANFSLESDKSIDFSIISKKTPHPFFEELQNLPISISVFDGNAESVVSNPFDTDLSYEISVMTDISEAEVILTAILDEFTSQYPLVNERLLPDNSIVFELERSQEQFLEVGQSNIDLNNQPNGLITYPNGQIKYSFTNNNLVIEKNVSEQVESVDKSCFLPQSNTFGIASGGFMQSTMWKSLEFSLNQQNLLLCVTQ